MVDPAASAVDSGTAAQQMLNASTAANAAGVAVHSVSVKVPPFWRERPDLWFSQIEAQFSVANVVADITKFNIVVAAIENNVLSQIADAVINPPATDKFGNLKRCIIERFSESDHQKIQKLLSDVDLGDRRPTQLLNELKILAQDKVTNDMLKSLWLQRLPAQVRAILQASNADLSELAKLADKVMEVGDFNRIAAVSNATRVQDDVGTRISRIEKRLNEFFSSKNNPRHRSGSRNRSRNPSRSASPVVGSEICWFHRTFKEKARRCRQPCGYSTISKN